MEKRENPRIVKDSRTQQSQTTKIPPQGPPNEQGHVHGGGGYLVVVCEAKKLDDKGKTSVGNQATSGIFDEPAKPHKFTIVIVAKLLPKFTKHGYPGDSN